MMGKFTLRYLIIAWIIKTTNSHTSMLYTFISYTHNAQYVRYIILINEMKCLHTIIVLIYALLSI